MKTKKRTSRKKQSSLLQKLKKSVYYDPKYAAGLFVLLLVVGYNYNTINTFASKMAGLALGINSRYVNGDSSIPVYYYTTGTYDISKQTDGTYAQGGQFTAALNSSNAPVSKPDTVITGKNINNYSIPVTTNAAGNEASASPTVPFNPDGDSVPGEKLDGLKNKAIRACWWVIENRVALESGKYVGKSQFELSIVSRVANNQPVTLKKVYYNNILTLAAEPGLGGYRRLCVQTDKLSADSYPGLQFNLKLTGANSSVNLWRVSRQVTENMYGTPRTLSWYQYDSAGNGDPSSVKTSFKSTKGNFVANSGTSTNFNYLFNFTHWSNQPNPTGKVMDTDQRTVSLYRDSSDGKLRVTLNEFPADLTPGPSTVFDDQNGNLKWCGSTGCNEEWKYNFALKDGVQYDVTMEKITVNFLEYWKLSLTDGSTAKKTELARGRLGEPGYFKLSPHTYVYYSQQLTSYTDDIARSCDQYTNSTMLFYGYTVAGRASPGYQVAYNDPEYAAGYCPGLARFTSTPDGTMTIQSGLPAASRDLTKPVVTPTNLVENQVVKGYVEFKANVTEANQLSMYRLCFNDICNYSNLMYNPTVKNGVTFWVDTVNFYGRTRPQGGKLPNGDYKVTLEVTDSSGNVGRSAPVTVKVAN